jgi:type IV pilus assembly protein PilV
MNPVQPVPHGPQRARQGAVQPAAEPGLMRQRGATLVEVLVALVLLTLGITAMTDLQLTALKLNHSAYLRSQSVALSYRVLDAMRANRGQALAGAYDRSLADPIPTAAHAANSVAAADLRAWIISTENAMRPYDGQASIQRSGTRVTVTLRWRDRLREEREGARSNLYETFTVVTEL